MKRAKELFDDAKLNGAEAISDVLETIKQDVELLAEQALNEIKLNQTTVENNLETVTKDTTLIPALASTNVSKKSTPKTQKVAQICNSASFETDKFVPLLADVERMNSQSNKQNEEGIPSELKIICPDCGVSAICKEGKSFLFAYCPNDCGEICFNVKKGFTSSDAITEHAETEDASKQIHEAII